MTITLRTRPLTDAVRRIVARDNGCWLDASDLSTMYQDATGTTPVTAMEQPVGLWLDKSQGLQLGPELVTNGDFSQGGTGWSTGNNPLYSELSIVDGKARLTRKALGGFATFEQAVGGFQIGKTYKMEFKLSDPFGILGYAGVAGVVGSRSGIAIFKASAEYFYVEAVIPGDQGAVGQYIEIDNISVRELKGNHATQSITASRPVVSARKNLLTETEFRNGLSDATINGGALSATTLSGYLGALSFGYDGVSITYAYKKVALEANTKYTLSCVLEMIGGAPVVSGDVAGATSDFALVAGSNALTQAATYNITQLSGNTYKVTCVFTSAASVLGPNVGVVKYATNSSRTFKVTAYELDIGDTSGTRYQRVNTATDYDTAGFPAYLKFDGVGDYLNLPYMGLYANGSASVVMAKSGVPRSADECFFAEGASWSNAQAYYFGGVSSAAISEGVFIRYDSGTTALYTLNDTSGNAQAPSVVSSFVDTGAIMSRYRNSPLAKQNAYTRGMATLNVTSIGASIRASNTSFYAGALYGLIITKSALSDADRRKCEVYLGRKAGVTL